MALATDREELQARTAESLAVRADLARLTEQLSVARGDDADLPARITRLTTEAERCEAVVAAGTEEIRARSAADIARRAVEERAARRGSTTCSRPRPPCWTPAGWPPSTGRSRNTTALCRWHRPHWPTPTSPTSRPAPTWRHWASSAPPRLGSATTRSPNSTARSAAPVASTRWRAR